MKKWFLNLRVGTKLLATFSVLAVMTLIVGLVGMVNIMKLQSLDEDLYNYQTKPLSELSTLSVGFERNRYLLLELVLETEPKKQLQYIQEINDNKKKLNLAMDKFAQTLHLPLEKKRFDYLKGVEENFEMYMEQVITLVKQGNNSFAYTVLNNDGPKLFEKLAIAQQSLGEIKQSNALQAATSNKDRARVANYYLGIFSMLAVVLAIVMTVMITKMMSKSLQAVAISVEAIAKGDLTKEIDAEYTVNDDEIGQLARGFGQMNAELRNLVSKVSDAASELASSADNFSDSANQTSLSAEQISHAINSISLGANNQVSELKNAVVAVTEMSEGTEKITKNSDLMTATASQALTASKVGSDAIAVAIKKMLDIKESVDKSAQSLAALSSRSDEIGQIVSTIAGISNQTNLLALNASIEAARAGEQGRGFAVVAEEVRKLAEESSVATKKISDLILAIQNDTAGATASMQVGTREVSSGEVSVKSAGEAFANISTLVMNVSEQIKTVANEINNISGDSKKMVEIVNKVERISRSVSEESETVSATTEQQTATMHELVNSSEKLANMAEQLQTMITHFRV